MWCSNMLTAEVEGTRIDAFTAEKGPAYICPQCRRAVTLKKGELSFTISHINRRQLVLGPQAKRATI